jgi:hypothetical protein
MGLPRNRGKGVEYCDSPTVLTFLPFPTGTLEPGPFVSFYAFTYSANRDPSRIPLMTEANRHPAFWEQELRSENRPSDRRDEPGK